MTFSLDKLIETALPLSRINARTISERTIAGHPANMHMWWGRSPHYSSIVSLTAALVDSPESREEIRNRSERVLETNYAEFGDKPTVFDPFSGFGGIPLAAQLLGLPAIASDLNPVAVMLTKAAAEIPARFAGYGPVNPISQSGSNGLAEDVLYYGQWLGQQVQQRLKPLYPTEPEGTVAAWIWARTIRPALAVCPWHPPSSSMENPVRNAGLNQSWLREAFLLRFGTAHVQRISKRIRLARAQNSFALPAEP